MSLSADPQLDDSPQQEQPQKPRFTWLGGLLPAVFLFFTIVILTAYGGYRAGIRERIAVQTTVIAGEIETQYRLGLEDFNTGECERARQRFEYVIQQDPNHARAREMLARVLVCLAVTATPTSITPTQTPTHTPTPDLRDVEARFATAQDLVAAGDWEPALAALQNLRKSDPGFKPAEVDALLYVAYRGRGIEKILNRNQLESGLYDLAQAESFGLLDAEAQSYRTWARFYLIGLTSRQVKDWAQAVVYLSEVAPYAPNLREGNNPTAINLYVEVLRKYINALAEQKAWCEAEIQVQNLRLVDDDPALESLEKKYRNRCKDTD